MCHFVRSDSLMLKIFPSSQDLSSTQSHLEPQKTTNHVGWLIKKKTNIPLETFPREKCLLRPGAIWNAANVFIKWNRRCCAFFPRQESSAGRSFNILHAERLASEQRAWVHLYAINFVTIARRTGNDPVVSSPPCRRRLNNSCNENIVRYRSDKRTGRMSSNGTRHGSAGWSTGDRNGREIIQNARREICRPRNPSVVKRHWWFLPW